MLTAIEFVKYSLEKGDTIESVAQKFDISINRLLSMHNINVPIEDVIKSQYDGFPKHLTFIYLTEEVVKNIEKKKFYGSPDKLFNHNTDDNEVLKIVDEKDLTYFGERFNCEPLGISINPEIKIEFITT